MVRRAASRNGGTAGRHVWWVGRSPGCLTDSVPTWAVTVYGVCAVSFMMAMYALEKHGRGFIVAFALGCLLSSAYGFLSGAWPFGVVEFIWSGIALRRYRRADAN
jgi:hypothetical protein